MSNRNIFEEIVEGIHVMQTHRENKIKAVFKETQSAIFGKYLGLYRDLDQFYNGTKVFGICLNLQVTQEVFESIEKNGLDKTIKALEESLNEQRVFGTIKLNLFFDGSRDERKYLSFTATTTNSRIKGFLGFETNEWKVYA